MTLENRGSGPLRLTKLFVCGDKDDLTKRDIDTLKIQRQEREVVKWIISVHIAGETNH
jgi:urocanate hydratase